jgi:catechol 2,3-dioxygenase-like lactoylglutathione lyase family enzyme
MELVRFRTPGGERLSFNFGAQKINLHEWGREFEPRAHVAVPGSLDLCFISAVPLDQVMKKFKQAKVAIIEGPVARTGARGAMRSVYVRDPDLNLVEVSEYES